MDIRIVRSVFVTTLLVPTAVAQTTVRSSVTTGGTQGNANSASPSVSADGNAVVFYSAATNLVGGDTNLSFDVFLRDASAATTTRVSVSSGGAQGDDHSTYPSISGNGGLVAFWSGATNLVAGDTNGNHDVFVRDLTAGTTTRINVDSTGAECVGDLLGLGPPAISGNGRFVAFESYADDLVAGDTNGTADIFLHDRTTGATIRISTDSAGGESDDLSRDPSMSGDGRYVVFMSAATNLVLPDPNGLYDVFLKDLMTGATTLLSNAPGGIASNGESTVPAISANGRHVAFESKATNLVTGDTNAHQDVFVLDRFTSLLTRESVDSTGAQANGLSNHPRLSVDGRFLAFYSEATNLVAADTNLWADAFLRDRMTSTTTRVSVTAAGLQSDGGTLDPVINADGRYVAFASWATNLVAGDTNASEDVFRRDRIGDDPFVAFCFGDGTGTACPCGNSGLTWRGCQNSAGTGGSQLLASGTTTPDAVVLTAQYELPMPLSIFLQATIEVTPGVTYGDGVRCVGGVLKRLYSRAAVGGTVSAPGPGDPSITTRSAALGDPIPAGATRAYQVYYRDPHGAFCPIPAGNTWNVSNALRITW